MKYRNIRVNVSTIGPTDTPIFETGGLTAEQIFQMKAALAEPFPQSRLAALEEIAKAAAFLASDDGSYMTSAELSVDGSLAQV